MAAKLPRNWENLEQIQSSVEQKEKTMELGGEQTGLTVISVEASLNRSSARFLSLGFPGIACAAGDSVMGCTWREGCISEGSALSI